MEQQMQLIPVKRDDLIANPEAMSELLFVRFLRYLDTSKRTVETYGNAVKQFFRYLYEREIAYPRRDDLIAYRESLKESGYKPTTVQNYIVALRRFFAWTEEERVYPNIAENLKGAKIDKEHKKDYLTGRQVKDVLNGIERDSLQGLRDYAILVLMVTGGLRSIELSRANIEDLRTVGEHTVLYIQGKGREEKTEYIKISAPVEKAIRAYLKGRGKADEGQPLFISLSNNSYGKRLSVRSISGIAKRYMQEAGYDSERLTAHSLRHTAVTLSLLAGKDITEVQQFARHSNIATTMIYNHSLDKAKNSCSQAITDTIFPA